jgi:hypothetical protein
MLIEQMKVRFSLSLECIVLHLHHVQNRTAIPWIRESKRSRGFTATKGEPEFVKFGDRFKRIHLNTEEN